MTSETQAPERIWAPWPVDGHVVRAWQSKRFEGGIEYVRADLVAKVKPLVWRDSYGVMLADTKFGTYSILEGRRCFMLKIGVALLHPSCPCETLEAAKAAAQADYERRMMAGLELAPVTPQQALFQIEPELMGEVLDLLEGFKDMFFLSDMSTDLSGNEDADRVEVILPEIRAALRAIAGGDA